MERNITKPPEGMTYVPEGKFTMGTSLDQLAAMLRAAGHDLGPDNEQLALLAELGGLLWETPDHEAVTGAFFIDVCEVTNEQYNRFVDDSGCEPPAYWKGSSYPEGLAKFPVVGVSLADAQAYASWRGKQAQWRGARLPTEVEWEKAARGVDGRPFPWGDSAEKDCHALPDDQGLQPVGSYRRGASPYGCLDMIGNVSEWTTSDFVPYPNTTFVLRPEMVGRKVVRGLPLYPSAHSMVKVLSRCAGRYAADPTRPKEDVGFRCVVPLAPPEAAEGAAGN
jgi:iron(II)-dependent oxidoreductase